MNDEFIRKGGALPAAAGSAYDMGVQIWAHRGASGSMPENTMAAFRRAIEEGADGIELDIQLTRDGEIVVCHDEKIDRTSSGTGYIKDYTLDELRKFNFNKTHPEVLLADIPTMQEVFDLVRPTKLILNIELKTGMFDYKGIEEKILAMTKDNGMEDRVIYSSFNHRSILRIQALKPDARTAFLCEDGPVGMAEYAAEHGVNAVHPWIANLRYPGFMEGCREHGLEVNAWPVNTESDARMCAKAGVHAVITNHPAYIRSVYEETRISPEYRKFIKGTLDVWMAECVKAHDIWNPDGMRLRAYSAVNPQEKASVVMIHGFCEFFGKYHETAYRLYRQGYSIFFVELRGHGDSARGHDYSDSRMIVSDFSEYVSDVETLIEKVAKPLSRTGRFYLLSHSMGGCVSALFLEAHPDFMRCAALSSPMISMDIGNVPEQAVGLLKVYSDLRHNDDEYAPGQHPFTGISDFEHSSEMDRDRYNYHFGMRLENPNYQTQGGTWGWSKAAIAAQRRAMKQASLILTPTLILQAGADTMVDNAAQVHFAAQIPQAWMQRFPGARHEIYNGTDKIREKWYHTIFRFYNHFDAE